MWKCFYSFNFRTTNHLEGWHRKLNAKIKVAHPTTFKFFRYLQDEEKSTALRMLQLENVHRLPPMLKKYRDLNHRLATLTSEFNDGERSLESYITCISNNLSDPTVVSREVAERMEPVSDD